MPDKTDRTAQPEAEAAGRCRVASGPSSISATKQPVEQPEQPVAMASEPSETSEHAGSKAPRAYDSEAPKVSIIVPVYNAQATIGRCVDSILDQEWTDFELLLVDDGSSDQTPTLLDGYAQRDGRVRVIHKENSGVSASRNRALDEARGRYVQFLDADDWISPEATRLLVKAMEDNEADLVIADFYRVIGSKVSRKGDIDEDRVLTREEFGAYMMEDPSDFYYGVLWNKLFRSDIINKHHLRMDVSLSWCEDFIFNMEYELHCRRIYPLQVPIYYYVKTKGSLVTQGGNIANVVQMKLNVIEYYNDFYKQVLDEDDYEARRPDIWRFYVESASDGSIMPWQRSTKLGEERVAVFQNPTMEADALVAHYYEGKLLERSLELVAARYGLQPQDVTLIDLCRLTRTWSGRDELQDFAGLGPVQLARSLSRLQGKGLLTVSSSKEDAEAASIGGQAGVTQADMSRDGSPKLPKTKKVITIDLTQEGMEVAQAAVQALRDCDRVRTRDMDETEAGRFRASCTKALKSVRDTLA